MKHSVLDRFPDAAQYNVLVILFATGPDAVSTIWTRYPGSVIDAFRCIVNDKNVSAISTVSSLINRSRVEQGNVFILTVLTHTAAMNAIVRNRNIVTDAINIINPKCEFVLFPFITCAFIKPGPVSGFIIVSVDDARVEMGS
jgi:hypothetical protein